MQRTTAFSRKIPDFVTEELADILTKKDDAIEFKYLFDMLHQRLKQRNISGGGEEMLRLRAYEKLQHLVSRNMVEKMGKKYRGLPSLNEALVITASLNASLLLASDVRSINKIAQKIPLIEESENISTKKQQKSTLIPKKNSKKTVLQKSECIKSADMIITKKTEKRK